MDKRLEILLLGLREAAIIIVKSVEDFLGMPLDKSALAKRREKIRDGC